MQSDNLTPTSQAAPGRRRIVIVGGGFGGLACARALIGADIDVTVVDKRNYHLFQPLLYQVSTAALSPADVATPIRSVLARGKNIRVVLGDVAGVDTEQRRVQLSDGGYLPFDQLVLATGAVYNYFGHPEWREHAPAPKTIGDARAIRAKLLKAFEDAENCTDPDRQRKLLTIVVVGGGPTGVEMAGTVAELAHHTLKGEFRRVDPAQVRIVLVEAGPRLLSSFSEDLGNYARDALSKLGVEVRLNCHVDNIDLDGIKLPDGHLSAASVIWAAGIRAAEGAGWLGGTEDRGGRLPVRPNLMVSGYENIFALGDLALFPQDGKPLPALAQVAQQQGQHLGKALRRPDVPPPFGYKTKGDTAVIGRHAAVYSYGRFHLKGRTAWLLWSIVHIYLLIGFEQRLLVMTQWIWRYFTAERGARIID